MDNELDRRMLLGAVGLVGVSALAASGRAGPLNPPAGLVSSTGHTLDEVYSQVAAIGVGSGPTVIPGGTSPVTISQPGTYTLGGDIAVTSGTAITVSAANVVLDLNGHTVSGPTSAGYGVFAGANVVVRNGYIRGFTNGVGLASGERVVEDLVVSGAGYVGIVCAGPSSRVVVRRCTVLATGGGSSGVYGILIQSSNVVVEGNVVIDVAASVAGTATGIGVVTAGKGYIADNKVVSVDGVGFLLQGPTALARKSNVAIGCTSGFSLAGTTDLGGNYP